MNHRLIVMLLAVTVVMLAAMPAVSQTETSSEMASPRTSWGAPDLRGIWDFRTMVPLERPRAFEGREFLTEEEAAEFEQRTINGRNNDNRSGNAAADVEGAYNDFWWDWGNAVSAGRISVAICPGGLRAAAIAAAPSGPTLATSAVVLTQSDIGPAMAWISDLSGDSY